MPELRPVLGVLGLLLATFGTAMMLPAIADLASDGPDWGVFAAAALLTTFIGVAMANATHTAVFAPLTIRQAFILTAAAWAALPAFGALPLTWSSLGLTYTDAYFEAVSGFTTTGSTVLTGLDAMPASVLIWRSLMQWLGGIGIIVVAIAVLPALGIGGMQLFRTESSDRSEKILPRAAQLAKAVLATYLGLTLSCAVAYGLGGMTAFDALNHAMATISTGGYSTHDASFGHYDSAFIHWAAIVFMLSGACPFVLYILAARGDPGRWWRSVEVRLLVGLVIGLTAILWLVQHMQGLAHGHEALRYSAFTVTTLITTTGFAVIDYTPWGPLSETLLFAVMFLGGCTGSTSGGLKMFRLAVLVQVVGQQADRLLYPSGVTAIRFADRRVNDEVVASVMTFVAVYMLVFAGVALALSLVGLDAKGALSASITALANVGPGLGPQLGPAGNFAEVGETAKWLLCLAMLLGRLELFTVLVLFLPRFWRE